MQRVWDADSEAEAEQSLGQAERPEVAIAEKERAGHDAPDQRSRGEHKVGQVRSGEECSGERHSSGFIREKAEQAVHEIVLQKKLLIDGPEHVAGDVGEIGFIEGMQRADLAAMKCSRQLARRQRAGSRVTGLGRAIPGPVRRDFGGVRALPTK